MAFPKQCPAPRANAGNRAKKVCSSPANTISTADAEASACSQVIGSKPVVNEYELCRYLRPNEIGRLCKKWEIPFSALLSDPGYREFVVKVDRVAFNELGYFEFERYRHDDSVYNPALIVVARDELAEPCDLVAWAPATGKFACWHGRVSMLGEQIPLEPRMDDLS
jgi:hypothetical protein